MFLRPGAVRTLLRGVGLATLLAAVACAAPPQKEMDQAQGAIDAARAAGAAQYASEEFTAAETALRRSNEAVQQRDYRQALNQALDARERAQRAAREAGDKKALARGEAERALTALELALAAAQQRVQAAQTAQPGTPRARRVPAPLAAALAALTTAVTAADAALQEARSHMEAQRFAEAFALAHPVPERLREATGAFDQARTAAPPAGARRRPR